MKILETIIKYVIFRADLIQGVQITLQPRIKPPNSKKNCLNCIISRLVLSKDLKQSVISSIDRLKIVFTLKIKIKNKAF